MAHAHPEGAAIVAGERLCVIEAMKMETNVTSTLDGTIEKQHVAEGARVEAGDLLITIQAD